MAGEGAADAAVVGPVLQVVAEGVGGGEVEAVFGFPELGVAVAAEAAGDADADEAAEGVDIFDVGGVLMSFRRPGNAGAGSNPIGRPRRGRRSRCRRCRRD